MCRSLSITDILEHAVRAEPALQILLDTGVEEWPLSGKMRLLGILQLKKVFVNFELVSIF